MSFRKRYERTLRKIEAELIRRFGLDFEMFMAKLTPKDNPHRDDPRFDWSPGAGEEIPPVMFEPRIMTVYCPHCRRADKFFLPLPESHLCAWCRGSYSPIIWQERGN